MKRSQLKELGPFWADLNADHNWGVEGSGVPSGHYVAIIPDSFTGDHQALATALASALNSACGHRNDPHGRWPHHPRGQDNG